jgi:hypothetical protein
MDGLCSKTGQGDCWRAENHDHPRHSDFVKAVIYAFQERVIRHFSMSRIGELWCKNTIKLPSPL